WVSLVYGVPRPKLLGLIGLWSTQTQTSGSHWSMEYPDPNCYNYIDTTTIKAGISTA
ncbi:hypothetical protein AVEN_100262-1, partial [Araneus ventricosus]